MFHILVNIIVPIIAGSIFFILAWYIKKIGPMRTLVTGEKTYRWAFWGFLFFGIYLASRPLQIFLGPHPMPLIVNNIREFFMIGLFAPAVFIAMMSFVYGSNKIIKQFVYGMFGFSVILALIFVVTNVFAIGGSKAIFTVGSVTAYDGLWFANPNGDVRELMKVLFAIRFINPVLLITIAGCIVLWRAFHYPPEKMRIYNNIPRKQILLAIANFSFSLSMFMVGIIYLLGHIPNQWWIYYVGAMLSGILEAISLSLPVRRKVEV
ncbi:MAG: hypothetical protein ABII23_09540 [bacterium]